MPSFSANIAKRLNPPLQVLFVIYPDIVLLDLAGPLQVFSGARRRTDGMLGYQTAITSLDGGPVPTDTIVSIETEPAELWLNRDIHTLVIVGGNGADVQMHEAPFVARVSELSQRAQRVCSVCSGALILASAGLLNGRRATTHWDDCAHLARAFPKVRVEIDPIYIKDGHIWTSAGITAGTDMALAMVAEDFGADAALDLAQSLVTYMVRPGGQSQFSPALMRQKMDQSGRFSDLHQWIANNLEKDLAVEVLAERENMSVRNFYRRYASTMGMTPARAVESMRVERARELLETSSAGMKSIAARCGFGDEERMRRAFLRLTGIPPSSHRDRFRVAREV